MTPEALFGIASGVIAFFEFLIYILAIYGFDYHLHRLGTATSPNRATWFIWGALGALTALSYWKSGATDTIWFAVAYALGFIIVALISITRGEGGIGRLDLICLAGAVVSAGLWWVYDSPEIALYATICIDAFGMIPTIRKAWLRPEGENRLAWTLSVVSCVLNIFAINWHEPQTAIVAYPVYMLLINGFVATLLYRPQYLPKRTPRVV